MLDKAWLASAPRLEIPIKTLIRDVIPKGLRLGDPWLSPPAQGPLASFTTTQKQETSSQRGCCQEELPTAGADHFGSTSPS